MVEPDRQQRLDVDGEVPAAIDASKPVAAEHPRRPSGVASGEVRPGDGLHQLGNPAEARLGRQGVQPIGILLVREINSEAIHVFLPHSARERLSNGPTRAQKDPEPSHALKGVTGHQINVAIHMQRKPSRHSTRAARRA